MSPHARRTLLFIRITPLNLCLVWLARLKGPVRYAESAVPERFLFGAARIVLEDELSLDEWCKVHDEVSVAWRSLYDTLCSGRWKTRICGVEVDLFRIGMQHLVYDFWKFCLLCHIAQANPRLAADGAAVVETFFLRYIRTGVRGAAAFPFADRCARSRANAALDAVSLWIKLAVGTLRTAGTALASAVRISRPGAAAPRDGSRRVLYICNYRPNFADDPTHGMWDRWLIGKGLFAPGEIVYYGAVLKDRDIDPVAVPRVRNMRYLMDDCSRGEAALCFVRSLGLLIAASVSVCSVEGLLRPFLAAQAVPWYYANRRYGFDASIYGEITLSPAEPSFVPLFNAMGTQTIVWQHAQSTFLFCHRYPLKDLRVMLSMLETQHCLCWNDHRLAKERERQIGGGRTAFRNIGPLIASDRAPCFMESRAARAIYLPDACGSDDARYRYVSVYDYRPMAGASKVFGNHASGYRELLEGFYADLLRLLERCGDIRVVIKTRPDPWGLRLIPKNLAELLAPDGKWVREKRVLCIPSDRSAYVAIGVSEMCVGMPFTSPVIAGLHFRRKGIFHDPSGMVTSHSYHDLDSMISSGYADFEKKVRRWLDEVSDRDFDAFLNSPAIKKFVGPSVGSDPALEFMHAVDAIAPRRLRGGT